jgi:hypothetical protein
LSGEDPPECSGNYYCDDIGGIGICIQK